MGNVDCGLNSRANRDEYPTNDRNEFTGEADVLCELCNLPSKPDMDKFNALIKAGAPIRTKVRRN